MTPRASSLRPGRRCGCLASAGAGLPNLRCRPDRRARTIRPDEAEAGEPEQVERLQALTEAFRPAAPIDRRALFSGRTRQLGDLFDVADQPGQHAVVYGERGVGKTSLVTVAAEVLAAADVLTARTTCDRSDDYESVWRKALGEVQFTVSRPGSASRVRLATSALVRPRCSPTTRRRTTSGAGSSRSRVNGG